MAEMLNITDEKKSNFLYFLKKNYTLQKLFLNNLLSKV